MPEVLSDSIPILSPALGFRRDVAMVTVSVIERTKGQQTQYAALSRHQHPRTAPPVRRANYHHQQSGSRLESHP